MTGRGELSRQSVWLTVLYAFLTGGIYSAVWMIKRAPIISGLSRKEGRVLSQHLAMVVLISSVLSLLSNVVGTFLPGTPQTYSPMFWAGIASRIFNWTFFIGLLSLSFTAREVLEARLGGRWSKLWTFLFTIFYLQYRINRAEAAGA